MTESPASYRSGFCAFVGRPNAGKSTLTNALVGSKIVITSDKPQTTRRAVRGVLSRPDGQLVIVDTPGLHRPRTLLGQRLNDVVRETLAEVDVVGFCIPANDKIGPGDRFIAAELQALQGPGDRDRHQDRHGQQAAGCRAAAWPISQLGEFVEIVPVSARAGDQVELLAGLLLAAAGRPAALSRPMTTDESEQSRIAELIREAALADVRDELPHSIAVTVEEMNPRARPVPAAAGRRCSTSSRPCTWNGPARSRSSWAAAAAGSSGSASTPAAASRNCSGGRVNLNLHVAVMGEWQRDPKKLDRLGF